MPRFHFHLRARGSIHRDFEGTELPDVATARGYAAAVADELMRHSGAGTHNWSMLVENGTGDAQFDLFFADVDVGAAGYSPQMRLLVMQTCRRLGALTDTLCAVRATLNESRMLIARSRGKPYLVYARRE